MNVQRKSCPEYNLARSKSMCSLQSVQHELCFYKSDRRLSESSVEIYVLNDSESESGSEPAVLKDSGIEKTASHGDSVSVLEQKFEKLNDLFQEQCKLLSEIKEEIRATKATVNETEHMHIQLFTDLMKNALEQGTGEYEGECEEGDGNSRARTLLDAIELQRANHTLHRAVKAALTNFLHSDELKEHMVSATVESVKDMVRTSLSHDVSSVYVPLLDRLHRRLLKHVTRVLEEAFLELEEHSAVSKFIFNSSKCLRRTLYQHQNLLRETAGRGRGLVCSLQHTLEHVLRSEVKEWRQKILDVLSTPEAEPESIMESPPLTPEYEPASPPQPADPERSIIDQLMMSAEISKSLAAGNVDGSFSRALAAGDLTLVMSACRAAPPAVVFGPPCRLRQPVLLSLVQQLATDMVHDTQLKCRYLEEALISLNTSHPATRAHLPLVIGDVRKHLKSFLQSYPSHVASRRITLIVMAADNLLK